MPQEFCLSAQRDGLFIVRGKTLDSILQNYSSIQNLWERALENYTDTDTKARIRRC